MRPQPAAVAALWLLAAAVAAQGAPRLRSVVIETGDVFSDAAAEGNLLYELANLLHAVTQESVIAREVWQQPGDRVTDDDVDELERNLRSMGLFGDATARLQRVGDDEADLVLNTRDHFTLQASASFALVGGVNRVSFQLSDANLLGTGKNVVAASRRNSNDEHQDLLRCTDPQFLGTWHRLGVEIGRTEEGGYANFALVRPFHRIEDPWSYGVEFATATERVDFFRHGDSTAEVPQQRDSVRLFGASGGGPRELRQALGLDLRLEHHDYDPAFGPDAGRIRVPGDTGQIEFGPYWTIDWRPRFEKVQGLDTLDYFEDLDIGVHGGARVAARYRDEEGAGSALQPVLEVEARAAFSPAVDTWVTVASNADARLDDHALVGWRTVGALHAYWHPLTRQTLAGSLTFDAAHEEQDLPTQLTLGEDNGLRGYPAREFAGTHFARLNLEERFDTGLEVLSVHVGGVAFFDAGWIDDHDSQLGFGTALRSAGCGLRLGSSHLFGGRVLRADVAWPLDEVDGRKFSVSFSLAIGQVFTFFGNSSILGSEF